MAKPTIFTRSDALGLFRQAVKASGITDISDDILEQQFELFLGSNQSFFNKSTAPIKRTLGSGAVKLETPPKYNYNSVINYIGKDFDYDLSKANSLKDVILEKANKNAYGYAIDYEQLSKQLSESGTRRVNPTTRVNVEQDISNDSFISSLYEQDFQEKPNTNTVHTKDKERKQNIVKQRDIETSKSTYEIIDEVRNTRPSSDESKEYTSWWESQDLYNIEARNPYGPNKVYNEKSFNDRLEKIKQKKILDKKELRHVAIYGKIGENPEENIEGFTL